MLILPIRTFYLIDQEKLPDRLSTINHSQPANILAEAEAEAEAAKQLLFCSHFAKSPFIGNCTYISRRYFDTSFYS